VGGGLRGDKKFMSEMKTPAILAFLQLALWVALIVFLLSAFVHCQQHPVPDVPSEVRAAIMASVKASDSPTADDKKGGHHEEGGMWGIDDQGGLMVLNSKPGRAVDMNTAAAVEIFLGDFSNPGLTKHVVTLTGAWHVHPSAVEWRTSALSGLHVKVREFEQPPSDVDIAEAVCNINIVVGARDGVVYFYDAKGVFFTEALDHFQKGPQ
jgi:hypothetical protein